MLQDEPVGHYDEAVAADPTIEDAPEDDAPEDDGQAQAQPMAAPAVDDEPAPTSQEVQEQPAAQEEEQQPAAAEEA